MANIDPIIDLIKRSSPEIALIYKDQLKAADSTWEHLFTDISRREEALRFCLALYPNLRVAKIQMHRIERVYFKSQKRKILPIAPKEIPVPQNAALKKYKGVSDRWFDPKHNVISSKQIHSSPCQTCALFYFCTLNKDLNTTSCKVLINQTPATLQSFMFIESKLPKKLIEDAKKMIVPDEDTVVYTSSYFRNN